MCNLDSGSCLCVSFCRHCSQSAASSGSARAACTGSALTFSDRNDTREMNFPGHTETDSRNLQYAKTSSTARNTSQQPAEQTATNLQYIRVLMSPHESSLVLHLGCSSMCFTALVRLIDGQMLQRVLCFFLLPSCSGARQRSQLQARSLCNG